MNEYCHKARLVKAKVIKRSLDENEPAHEESERDKTKAREWGRRPMCTMCMSYVKVCSLMIGFISGIDTGY